MIADIISKLKNKEISALELTKSYLNKIESENPDINAFITVTN